MAERSEIFVLRHGETEWNRAGRMQGLRDSPLTARGRAQAVAMAGLLRDRAAGLPVLSSPLARARDTARIVAAATGGAVRCDPRLAEIGMGAYTGLSRAEIAARFPGPAAIPDLLDWYASVPGGEPLAALRARVRAVLAGDVGRCVIVTHGVTGLILRAEALGVDPRDLPGGQGVVFQLAGGRHAVLRP